MKLALEFDTWQCVPSTESPGSSRTSLASGNLLLSLGGAYQVEKRNAEKVNILQRRRSVCRATGRIVGREELASDEAHVSRFGGGCLS